MRHNKRLQLTRKSVLQTLRGIVWRRANWAQRWRSALLRAAEPLIRYAAGRMRGLAIVVAGFLACGPRPDWEPAPQPLPNEDLDLGTWPESPSDLRQAYVQEFLTAAETPFTAKGGVPKNRSSQIQTSYMASVRRRQLVRPSEP